MHKKTFNIAAVCLVALLVAFTFTQKNKADTNYANNIETDSRGGSFSSKNKADAYQAEILKTVLDQNIKSFEQVSESFKKKPTDTLSDTISKNVFSQYIEYNTSKSLDVGKIQEETVAAIQAHPVAKSDLGLQNIRVIENNIVNLKSYGNRIAVIQNGIIKAVYKIRNKTDQSLYIKNIYNTAADLYMKEPVPEKLAAQHLKIINAYKDYSNGIKLIQMQGVDPAKALTGVQLAKDAQDSLISSFETIKKIVLLNNIKYVSGEPAFEFINATSSEQIKIN